MKSRRKFLKLVALSSAVALVPAVTPRRARTAPASPAPGAKQRPPALEAEIRKQEKATAATLKTIRDYELAPGSEPAFVFAPARVVRRGGKQGGSAAKGGSR